jgi:regulator of protease activity HflC (stomatin/prohibitin superfamily)
MISELFLFLLLILLIVWYNIIVVSVNRFVVLVTFGRRFSRVLHEGINVKWPWETTTTYCWTFVNQQFQLQRLRLYSLPVTGQQIDIAPFECETKDGHPVSIDVMLVYRVEDAQKATYATEDTLSLLTQQVVKFARRAVVNINRDMVIKNEMSICSRILEGINKDWTPIYGLALETCEIQGISQDEDTIRRRRQMRDGIGKHDQATIEQAYAYSARSGSKGPNVILNATRN